MFLKKIVSNVFRLFTFEASDLVKVNFSRFLLYEESSESIGNKIHFSRSKSSHTITALVSSLGPLPLVVFRAKYFPFSVAI